LEPLENEKCSLFSGTCVDGCEEDSKQGGWNVKKMEGAVQGLGRCTLGGDRESYGQKDERTCALTWPQTDASPTFEGVQGVLPANSLMRGACSFNEVAHDL